MEEKITLQIEGMTCHMCVKHVTQALQSVTGVSAVEVHLDTGSAQVVYDPTAADLNAFKEAVAESGYKVVA